MLAPHPTQAGGAPLVGCPQLLTRSYRPSPPSPTIGRAMLRSAVSSTQLTFVTKRNSLRDASVHHFPSFAVPMTSSNTAAANRNAGTRRGITTLCRHLETQTETDGRSLAAELGHAVRVVHWTGMWQRRGKDKHIRIIRSLSSRLFVRSFVRSFLCKRDSALRRQPN